MKATDESIRELIKLLKNNPELISALVLDPDRIQKLLKSKGARRVALGEDVENFLRQLTEADGGPLAQCIKRTEIFCGSATILMLGRCIGGTRPPFPLQDILPDEAKKKRR